MKCITNFLLAVLVVNPSYGDYCKKSYSQWTLDQATINYISTTAINHSKLEIKNYTNWANCTQAKFAYGVKSDKIPEGRKSIAKSLRSIGVSGIRSFLEDCEFPNNYIQDGFVGDDCPDRSKIYSKKIESEGQTINLSCTISDAKGALIITIGPLIYSFPYSKNEIFAPNKQSRNLDKNINQLLPSISVHDSPAFESCSSSTNFSLNFCRHNGIQLLASPQSLVCVFDEPPNKFCAYGDSRRSSDNLRISSHEACPLSLKKEQSQSIESTGTAIK